MNIEPEDTWQLMADGARLAARASDAEPPQDRKELAKWLEILAHLDDLAPWGAWMSVLAYYEARRDTLSKRDLELLEKVGPVVRARKALGSGDNDRLANAVKHSGIAYLRTCLEWIDPLDAMGCVVLDDLDGWLAHLRAAVSTEEHKSLVEWRARITGGAR